MTGIACPIQPHELDKRIRSGMDDIVMKVVTRAVVEGRGQDLLLRVYMAGMYHGVELSEAQQDRKERCTP